MSELKFGKLLATHGCVGVIMAGGSGTRFWPASRKRKPKQFLSLGGDSRSLIQLTADRLTPLCGREGIIVVGGVSQRALIEEHLPGVAMLLEPIARNTAPCVAYAAALVLATVGDVPMVCVPADHLVRGVDELESVFRVAIEHAAASSDLVTIGIKPTAPETGYGYVKAGGAPTVTARPVVQFVEKPDFATAKSYVESGQYYWNSGIFVWRPTVILGAIAQCLPALGVAAKQLEEQFRAGDVNDEVVRRAFSSIDPISIDFGVLEKSPNVSMVPGVGFEWNDVGSWSAWVDCLAQEGARDKELNLLRGDTVIVDSKRCAVASEKRLVALVGVEDLIVIETADSVLVCHRDKAQDVKKVVDALSAAGRSDLL